MTNLEFDELSIDRLIQDFGLSPQTILAIFCLDCQRVLYDAVRVDTVTSYVAARVEENHFERLQHSSVTLGPDVELIQSNMDPAQKIEMFGALLRELRDYGEDLPPLTPQS